MENSNIDKLCIDTQQQDIVQKIQNFKNESPLSIPFMNIRQASLSSSKSSLASCTSTEFDRLLQYGNNVSKLNYIENDRIDSNKAVVDKNIENILEVLILLLLF